MARLETAACFCGEITAKALGEPFWICFDHDDDCRRAIGSPLTIWVGYKSNEFSFVTGEPKTYSKTEGVTRSFCGNCGTSIGYVDAGLPSEIYLCIGFMDHPENFPPQAQTYWSLRLPFIKMDDGLKRIEAYSRPRRSGFKNPNER
jgi:hypothetical protein